MGGLFGRPWSSEHVIALQAMPTPRKARRNPGASKVENPFGGLARQRALLEYVSTAGTITAENAWRHVYRLLLSIDRRTKLAHVYDANHMQPGGTFHSRAQRFTDLLCTDLGVSRSALASEIDRMFQACVAAYRAQKAVGGHDEKTISDEEASSFVVDVAALLAERLGVAEKQASYVAAEIERKAEDYFTIGQKRQNVRGEGFEDVLAWLLRNVAGVPAAQLRVRIPANALPGFKPELPSPGKRRDKVPKPDLAITAPEGHATIWIVTAKWSLRQDRLDQFGQEFAYYKAHQTQQVQSDLSLVTNEMDVARLRDVLAPPPGGGGFYFPRVYHVNAELLEQTHEVRFHPLRVYRSEARLLSLHDLLVHARTQFGGP
jgi:hypothetical protein